MHLKRIIALLASAWTVLTACTIAARPTLPTDSLLTPAALPAPIADGESAPLAPPDSRIGASIYAEKCAACHGVTGAGDGPRAGQIRSQGGQVANLIDPARMRAATPTEWHQLITDGRLTALMPGFSGSLSAQERWATTLSVRRATARMAGSRWVMTNSRSARADSSPASRCSTSRTEWCAANLTRASG
jgi:mono/diheme cytochrome c family protein